MISASIEARPVPGAAWQHIARVIWHPWKSAARFSWWSRALSVSENPVFYDTAFYGTTIFAPGAPLGSVKSGGHSESLRPTILERMCLTGSMVDGRCHLAQGGRPDLEVSRDPGLKVSSRCSRSRNSPPS